MTGNLRNALLIHNPNAGHGGSRRRSKLDEARKILRIGGIETEIAETRGPGHATELVRCAGAEGRDLVIACGGDGTVNEVVNGLAEPQSGARVPMALLPGGTANILAKEIGLSWDIPGAAHQLVDGELKDLALGLATPLEHPDKKRYFLSVAGAGPDGMIVYAIDLELKASLGILAYWWQGARELLRYSFPRFRVRTGEQELDVSLLVIGRTKHYGGPFRITTEADLFGDKFELMGLTTQNPFRYLSYLPALWTDRLRGAKGVYFWKAKSLICEPLGKNPLYAQIDGEPLARLPVEFKVVPNALQLLVPAKATSPAAGPRT